MGVIDQNSAILALETALVPGGAMIDGRTERDLLSFVAGFASLINFYDETNSINGSWQPFLLKDPVFLLASISKTPFPKYHSLFKKTCANLRNVFAGLIGPQSPQEMLKSIFFYINQLFDQLTSVFMMIERWTYYMLSSADVYEFKNYVLKQVKTRYSGLFWAMVSFREQLSRLYNSFGLEPVRYYLFDNFDAETWKLNKDREPYWSVLETPTQCIKYPLVYNPDPVFNEYILDVLVNLGDQVFNFFYGIIQNAATVFEQLKTKPGRYPDTVLIRAFLNIFQTHQNQLNGLAAKHLEFYYNKILKQGPRPGVPDAAFICVAPNPKTGILKLPAGALFNAGLDKLKSPITFGSDTGVSLNPGKIISAHTFYVSPAASENKSGISLWNLGLEKILNPGSVKKGAAGEIQSWQTFGGSPVTKANVVQPAIVFASPLLFLEGGTREVTFKIICSGARNSSLHDLFKNAQFYFSTQKEWILVSIDPLEVSHKNDCFSSMVHIVSLKFFLEDTLPSIVPFSANPEKLVSVWPMFKIEFSESSDWSNDICVKGLTVEVDVEGLNTSQLYNDFGALSTKTPCQLFGPAPLVGSNFIFGNREVFSKPLVNLVVRLQWDKLPKNFAHYYRQYNRYLNRKAITSDGTTSSSSWVGYRVKKFFNRILLAILRIFHSTSVSDELNEIVDFIVERRFNDLCFRVNFQVLDMGQWTFIPERTDIIGGIETNQLFEVTNNVLDPLREFKIFTPSFNYLGCDPYIQTQPLQFSSSTQSGFIKMELCGFKHGFGSILYPKVANYFSLKNAKLISLPPESDISSTKLKDLPNLPFAPKITSFSIKQYTAFEFYSFDYQQNQPPIQCFSITPFKNCLVYDSSKLYDEYTPIVNLPFISECSINEKPNIPKGFPLLPHIDYSGYLFLEFDELIAPCTLNLYFEMTVASDDLKPDLAAVDFFALTQSGWLQISLLSDSTNGFTTSGIVCLDIPAGMDSQEFLDMPKSFWLAVAARNQNIMFSKTAFLQTNGIKVSRVGIDNLSITEQPYLESSSITRPQSINPQIVSVTQPFPSFGGKAADTQAQLNQFVSNRLKTKERAINDDDYFRLIKGQFNDIFYCRTLFDPQSNSTGVFLVKSYSDWRQAGAFLPFVSDSIKQDVAKFLSDKVSMFAKIQMMNFVPIPIIVKAFFSIKAGYEWAGVVAAVNHSLNIYLSPWINSIQEQYPIWDNIQEGAVASFLRTVDGVDSVSALSFLVYSEGISNDHLPPLKLPLSPGTLIVSALCHYLIPMD